MKLYTLALVGVLGVFGVSAEAQTCGVLCDEGFWKSASEAEVKAEISKADVTARGKFGGTALFYATAAGTKLLLDAGADVNARGKFGGTALMSAATFGTAEQMRMLLDAGADVNAMDMLFMTALIYAARLNHAAGGGVAEQVTMLLGAGADGSVKDILGQTAWDHAQNNEKLKDTEAYWMLNYARFK